MKQIRFRLTAYTDPAGKRNDTPPLYGNEDNLFVDADLSNAVQGRFMSDRTESLSDYGCLMAVADGMGGANAGEVASAIAVETVKRYFAPEKLTPAIVATAESRERYMERVVAAADEAIKRGARTDPACEGMGSTLILMWLCADSVTVTWCGDSRAYLFRESEGLRQISKDHSYVQSLVDEGKITAEEAFDHPYGNIITRSLGDPEKKARPDSVTIPVYRDDILMLCSDGLSGVLRDRPACDRNGNPYPGKTIEELVRANRDSMQACREALWHAAEEADWYDNVTAILCRIEQGEEAPPTCVGAETPDLLRTRSFVHFRLRKRTLRIVGCVVSLLVLTGALVFVLGERRPRDVRSFAYVRDSLVRVADSLRLHYVSAGLNELPDSSDWKALDLWKERMTMRIGLSARIDTLRRVCAEAGYTGLSRSLATLQSDVGRSERLDACERAMEAIGRSIEFLDGIGAYIDSQGAVEAARVAGFYDRMRRKERITEEDLRSWEALKRCRSAAAGPDSSSHGEAPEVGSEAGSEAGADGQPQSDDAPKAAEEGTSLLTEVPEVPET